MRRCGRRSWPVAGTNGAAAWKFANAALNEDPDSIEALYLAGRALRDFGHMGLSLHLFRRALALDSTQAGDLDALRVIVPRPARVGQAREAYLVVHKPMPNDSSADRPTLPAGYVQQGGRARRWSGRRRRWRWTRSTASRGWRAAFATLGLGRWADGWK